MQGYKADKTPRHTKTIIAGANLIAVDIVGGQKMGLDPMNSRFVKLAAESFGKPEIRIVGDISLYADWENVPPGIDRILNYGEEWYGLSNMLGFISSEMDPFFPIKITSRITIAIRRIFLWISKAISFDELKRKY